MISVEDYAKRPRDLPYHEPPEPITFRCDFCGDDVPECDRVLNVDCPLCSDCIGEYCKSKAENSDIISSFISEKAEQFYMDWYFKGLEPNEKLALVKNAYAQNCSGIDGNKDPFFIEMEKEFCIEDDNFFEFLQEGRY